MGSIGALGIGLSVVFSLFLLLLLAELYYLLFWKQSSRMNSVAPDRGIGSNGTIEPATEADNGFVAKIILGNDGECTLAPPRLLFTIKEETREDLIDSEDAKSRKRAKSSVPPPAAPPRPDHVVLHVKSSPLYSRHHYGDGEAPLLHVCSSSTSSDASPASSSSSSSCSSSFKPATTPVAAAVAPRASTSSRDEEEEEDEDIDGVGIENRSWASAQGTATEDDAFVTPPSSPGFSSPASSPAARIAAAAAVRRSTVRAQDRIGIRIIPGTGVRISSSAGSPSSSSIAESPPLSPMHSSHCRDDDNDDDEDILLARSVVLPSPSPSVSLASESWHN